VDDEKKDRPQIVLVSRSVVLRDDGRFLLILRSKNDRHHPGLWECPGGKLESGQDVAHAQEDEVVQETGLLVHLVDRLVYFDSFISSIGSYVGLPYIVLFGIAHYTTGSIKLSFEHDDYAWVTFGEALQHDLTPETRKALLALEKRLV